MKSEATEAMVVVMEERATEAQIEQVVARLVEMGMDVHRSTGVTRTVLGAVGQGHPDKGLIEMLDGVHEVVRISEPYKLASRTFKQEPTVVARARRFSAAERSSRAARPTASRASASRASNCCATQRPRRAWRSSPK